MTQGEARTIAARLLREHGLDEMGWTFKLDKAKRRAGLCDYEVRVISISGPQLNSLSYAGSLDTILHEVAHALLPHHGHDQDWKDLFLALGGNGKRLTQAEEILVPLKPSVVGTCPACGIEIPRYRRPSLGIYIHKKCESEKRPVVWRKNGQILDVSPPPPKRRTLTLTPAQIRAQFGANA